MLHKPYDFKSASRLSILPYTRVGQLIIIAEEVSDMLDPPESQDASFMCSELVFRAFEICGAPLTKKPAYCMTPNSLFHTGRLACLGRLA